MAFLVLLTLVYYCLFGCLWSVSLVLYLVLVLVLDLAELGLEREHELVDDIVDAAIPSLGRPDNGLAEKGTGWCAGATKQPGTEAERTLGRESLSARMRLKTLLRRGARQI